MRVGIIILPDQRWRVARERWRRAEEYGFDHAWTYDHLGWRELVDGPWFDAVTTLTAAAAVTTRIRLGTMVASPNFRHPVHFAREITALDDISDGRVTLGIGSGGTAFDASVLGGAELSARVRANRFAEFVELLDRVLAEDRVTWQGEHYTAIDARGTPGCVQRPRVPFVIAANGPRAMRLAARFGQGWVTTGKPAGVNPEDLTGWWRSVADVVRRFDGTLAEAGIGSDSLNRYLSLDAAPVFSLTSVAAFTDAVGRARELGFTDVLTHWPREDGWYAGAESVLDAIAADVLPHLGGDKPNQE